MGEARAEITIDQPADDVWAKIGNFGDLLWMPGVETCELRGEDDRLLVVIGPCSIHDTQSALEYATKLSALRRELADYLCIVMRVY